MSFGWSAGDIAVAIQLVTKIVRALNDAQGSGEDYRRTSSYLASVGIVLGQIRTIIDAQKDETYILEPDDLSNLESVVKPLRTLTEQLMNKIGSFAKFEEKGKSLLQRTALEFSKVRWEFMLKDEVKIIVENIDRQIAIWATFWSMISLKIYLSVHRRSEITAAIYQSDNLSYYRLVLQRLTAADSNYPPGLLSIGPHDGVPSTTDPLDKSSPTHIDVKSLISPTHSDISSIPAPTQSNISSILSPTHFDIGSVLLRCGKYKQPNMSDQVAARVNNMKFDRVLVRTIDNWLKGESAPRLWLYGRAASTVSATIFSTAFKRNRHIVAYSCRFESDGKLMDLEKRMIGLAYSALFQMLQQVSEQTGILLPTPTVDVDKLDGTIDSVTIAIVLIKHILETIHDFVFIIDGFQYLAVDPSNAPSVKVQECVSSILDMFERDIVREYVGMGPRLLLTTAGNVPLIHKKDTKYLTRLFVDDHKDRGQFTLAHEMLGVEW